MKEKTITNSFEGVEKQKPFRELLFSVEESLHFLLFYFHCVESRHLSSVGFVVHESRSKLCDTLRE